MLAGRAGQSVRESSARTWVLVGLVVSTSRYSVLVAGQGKVFESPARAPVTMTRPPREGRTDDLRPPARLGDLSRSLERPGCSVLDDHLRFTIKTNGSGLSTQVGHEIPASVSRKSAHPRTWSRASSRLEPSSPRKEMSIARATGGRKGAGVPRLGSRWMHLPLFVDEAHPAPCESAKCCCLVLRAWLVRGTRRVVGAGNQSWVVTTNAVVELS